MDRPSAYTPLQTPLTPVDFPEVPLECLCVAHGSKLENSKGAAAQPQSSLSKERWPGRVQFNCDRENQPDRRRKHKANGSKDEIENALRFSLPSEDQMAATASRNVVDPVQLK